MHGLRHTVNIRLRHECHGAIGRLKFACSSGFLVDIAASFRKKRNFFRSKQTSAYFGYYLIFASRVLGQNRITRCCYMIKDQNSPGPLPKNPPLVTFSHGTELASYVLDPTVFPHQSNLTAWYPRAKKIMIVAMAVPVSIAACNRSKNENS